MTNEERLRTSAERLQKINSARTPEERMEIAHKAGLASGASRRRKRAQKDILRDMLSLGIHDEDMSALLADHGLPSDYAEAINLAVMLRAIKGDIEAVKYIRDTIGEKPKENTVIQVAATPMSDADMSQYSDAELEAMLESDDHKMLCVSDGQTENG